MFELLLGSALPPLIMYPNSGPGPMYLKLGNEDIGYFGEVSSAELITYVAYKDHLNPALLVDINSGTLDKGWFKFMHQGKVKFISKYPLGDNLSWEALYKAGGIYGTNDNGTYPSPAAGPYFNQYKPISVTQYGKTWTMVPKAMTGAQIDPTTNPVTLSGSEFDDLLCRICICNHPNSGLFATYVKTLVAMQVEHFVLETNSSNNTAQLIRNYGGTAIASFQSLPKTARTGYAQYWRGVLVVEGDPKAEV